MKRFMCVVAILFAWPTGTFAITVDGGVDAEYGPAVAVQGTGTQFGDNQSELDAAYAKLDGSGNLSLMFTGNIQNNSNGLVLLIDSRLGGAVASSLGDNSGVIGSVGGQKTQNWGTDIDSGAGVNTPPGGGSILDPGFNPDMALTFSHFGVDYFMNVIDLTLQNDDAPQNQDKDVYHDYYHVSDGTSVDHLYTRADGNLAKGHNTTLTTALNNTNTAGVTDTDASGALTATTGMEVLLPAAFLNNAGQPIRLMAFISNGGGDFLANQFLGDSGIGNVGNLGSPGGTGGEPLFDGREFTGNQFITIATSKLNGDFNGDSKVNAADYVSWRSAVGATPFEYNLWRSNFGAGGSGAGSTLEVAGVPEPTSLVLAILGALMGVGIARRK